MIISLLLLQAAAQIPAAPSGSPETPVLPTVSCNVAVALFAPRSDLLDEKATLALDKIPAEARAALDVEGVKLMVLPHPVTLSPADEARQRSIFDGRGRKIRDYLTARGYPADRIGIRPAEVNPGEEKNWTEGALLMVESTPDAWAKTRLGAIC
jgi:hypothetical protein